MRTSYNTTNILNKNNKKSYQTKNKLQKKWKQIGYPKPEPAHD